MNDDNNKNVFELKHTKKVFNRIALKVYFNDGTEEEIQCTYFGISADAPQFMIFSNSHPDSTDETEIPEYFINIDTIKHIKTISIDQVER